MNAGVKEDDGGDLWGEDRGVSEIELYMKTEMIISIAATIISLPQ